MDVDNINNNKRRRLEDSVVPSTSSQSRTAALEAELLRLRAENAGLLQERQLQQHRQGLASAAAGAGLSALDLDRLAVLRSLASPPPSLPSSNFSSALAAQQRFNSFNSAHAHAHAHARLSGLSTEHLLSLSGGSAAGTTGLRSLPGLSSTSRPSLPTAATSSAATPRSAAAGNLLGQAFQQRLQRVQQQQQQQQHAAAPGTGTPSGLSVNQLSEEMKLRLQRLQQLSNLQQQHNNTTSTSNNAAANTNLTGARPTFRPSALPTPRNNNNLSTLDSIVQAHFPAPKEKKPNWHSVGTANKEETNNTESSSSSNKSTRKRKPQLLYMTCDDQDLSQYQTQVRKQIELFEADTEDTATSARGRNRPIVAGQVGIRCKHCKVIPPQHRQRAAIYYPSKLDRLYQMSQTIASVHLADYCQHIPAATRAELARLRETKSAALGGKKYWADAGRAMGLVQVDKRLFYQDSPEAKEQQDKLAAVEQPTSLADATSSSSGSIASAKVAAVKASQ